MNWKLIKSTINWDSVHEDIISSFETVTSDRLKTAKKQILDAAEYFVPLDLKWFEIVAVEKEYEHVYSPDFEPDKGIIDLILKVKPDAGKPYKDYIGETLIVDWKSTGGELNTDWRNRYIPSWQWKRYAVPTKAKLFEYRGISQKQFWSAEGFKSTCGPIILEVPANNYENVREDFIATAIQRRALSQLTIWPRNAPSACYKYGETCKEKDFCDKFTMTRGTPQIKHTSYSSDELFKQCPEKYRAQKLRNEKIEDYESASFMGTMIHRGMANIYNQLKDKQ
ncbi:hypothetical protein UFOVP434_10 [uncultured Caudovirales phage]|uniref:PD-(D/E)XK nuclease superfamily n=1 Tax=uncultured Caudovirales phage TaxID=2100421 RepID=A0A6J5MFE0_9CAUD|nr:hypothetical protein UFOVP434_10 [uncultured Caudovirales phage]